MKGTKYSHSVIMDIPIALNSIHKSLIYRFNIYFDNYFSNATPFANLRALGIGACGTARNSTISEDLRVDKNTVRKVLAWDHTSTVIDNGVLCGLWQDNNTVNHYAYHT